VQYQLARALLLVGGFLLFARTARADDAPRSSATGSETWTTKPSRSFQSLFGARVGGFSASGEKNAFAGGVSVQTAGYENLSYFSTRVTSTQMLGSSNHGVEGLYTGDLGLGVIAPLGEGHGAIMRLGLRGYMMGNERVWLSMFEIPSGHVGYQYKEGAWLFEAAARGGLVVTGRHTLYGELQGFEVLQKRVLGHPSWEYGGHLALGVGPLRGEIEYMRIAVDDGIATPLEHWTASACFRNGGFGVCGDYRTWRADVPRVGGAIEPLAVSYGGMSIGFWIP
jgi:hypothetical protein